MAKTRRSFSVEQKLQIIQEAEQNGVTQTLRKHNLAHSLFSGGEVSSIRAVQNCSAAVSQSGSGAQGIAGRKRKIEKDYR